MIYKTEMVKVTKYAVSEVHSDCSLIYELVFINADGSFDDSMLFDNLSESLFYANYFSTVLKNSKKVELRAFEIPDTFNLESYYSDLGGDIEYYLYRDNYKLVNYYDFRENKD